MFDEEFEDERSKETQKLPAIKDPRHETTRKMLRPSSSRNKASKACRDKTPSI